MAVSVKPFGFGEIKVGGKARIDGGTVVVIPDPTYDHQAHQADWPTSIEYPILTAKGGVTGTAFKSVVVKGLPYLIANLRYTPSTVYLKLSRK